MHTDSAGRPNQSVCLPVTYNPSASISGHVTVDLNWLALVPPQVDGVEARRGVTVEQRLGAVSGVPVQHASYTQTHTAQQ